MALPKLPDPVIGLTPWFSATTQKPVRNGWYDFYDGLWHQQVRAMWNGEYWVWDEGSRVIPYPGDKWRGLLGPETE
jgi:hypothetical protein